MRICRDLFYNLYEKLKDADCINLQEHSSFTQALNLKLDDKLISILNEDKVLAPYSLTLPIDFFTKYSPHNHLFFNKPSATYMELMIDTPPPQPSCKASCPESTEPTA